MGRTKQSLPSGWLGLPASSLEPPAQVWPVESVAVLLGHGGPLCGLWHRKSQSQWH